MVGGCELTPSSVEKAHKLLVEALDNAPPDEELRLIFTLRRDQERTPGGPNPHVKKPKTRAEFRQLAITANNEAFAASNSEAIQALRQIGLTVRGSGAVGALVVDGTASQLRRGISLGCVRTAILDRPLVFDKPAHRSKRS